MPGVGAETPTKVGGALIGHSAPSLSFKITRARCPSLVWLSLPTERISARMMAQVTLKPGPPGRENSIPYPLLSLRNYRIYAINNEAFFRLKIAEEMAIGPCRRGPKSSCLYKKAGKFWCYGAKEPIEVCWAMPLPVDFYLHRPKGEQFCSK
eukprot:Gb_03176 [translate_table: standard]